MFSKTLAVLAGLTLSLATGAAAAQTVCGDREEIVESLRQSFNEEPAAMGLSSSGALMEILTSERGSWTLMLTMPTGQTCVLAAGEHWESLPKMAMRPDA